MNASPVKTIKCCRCSGTGFYCNADGRICFRCNGAGTVVADAFLRVMGTGGKFFGITGPVINGEQFKGIARNTNDLMDGYTAEPITEDQARAFFSRYGVDTVVQVAA
jgi:hypothetical protein